MKRIKIKETASFNKIVHNEGDFDTIPDSFYSTQSGYPVPEKPGLSSTLYEEEEEDVGGDEGEEFEEDIPPESPPEADIEGETEEKTVNELQNEIISSNLEVLKSISSEMNKLNNQIQSLDKKLDDLSGDVEEVREPTNVEKLVQQKDVSYPYYFNLNDYWKGNWFNKQHSVEGGEGGRQVGAIKQLPDGSFVADFDDLPSESFIDIEKSFHEIT